MMKKIEFKLIIEVDSINNRTIYYSEKIPCKKGISKEEYIIKSIIE
jgi:extradiol dioxygenase family protein